MHLEVLLCTISSSFSQKLVQHVKIVYSAGNFKLVKNPDFDHFWPNIGVFGQFQVSGRILDFNVLHKFRIGTRRNRFFSFILSATFDTVANLKTGETRKVN